MLFGAYYLVSKNKYGVGEGGIRMPEAQVPAEDYSAINFANVSEARPQPVVADSPSSRKRSNTLETGGITNEALRDQGLCLLSGYFTELQPVHAEIAVSHDRKLRFEVQYCSERRGGRRVHDPGRRRGRDRKRGRRYRPAAAPDPHDPVI